MRRSRREEERCAGLTEGTLFGHLPDDEVVDGEDELEDKEFVTLLGKDEDV